ncbi:Tetracycline resistance protein, class C [Paenibacillus konkukensis]|uniref:Tetracycline resistance protein, class C n=1 Tax=Paenibacillus konkukensis TaxID=2020716 RepID=A0ABY4S395_9BACL|nr:MFS transporter [Paenibacillus konkukensis]UQZ87667.1 Tetracycline resistance protein, class C [Paenibacillus konkukensis]
MKQKFIMIFLTVLFAMISIATFNPILGPLSRNMGLSEIQTGSLVTVTGICWILGSFVWGRKPQLNRKRVMAFSLLAYTVTVFLFAYMADQAQSAKSASLGLYWGLFGLRAIAGFCFGAVPAMAQGYLMEWTTADNRTSGMALFGAANGLGFVLGPAMGAGLASVGLTAPMYVSAALIVLITAAFWLVIPAERSAGGAKRASRLSPLDPRVRLYLSVGLLLSTVMIIFQVTAGFYMQDNLAVNTKQAAQMVGIGLTLGGVIVVLAQLIISRYMNRKPAGLLKLGLPFLALGFLFFLLYPASYLLAFALFGLGIGFTMPGYAAAASLAVEEREQSGVASFVAAAQGVGSVIGPIVGTSLYSMYKGLPYMLCILLAALFTVLVLWHVRGGRMKQADSLNRP